MSLTIHCTLVNCNCQCFKPGKINQRQCDQCKHGWVAHALSKLRMHHLYQNSQVEIVQSNVVFDISSLMLYGTQAIPVRLKILLDRLFSVLKQEEVIQILHALEWTLQDYIRGYVLQDASGKVLDRWVIMTYEEELATLQQFLRFGETKSIVELMAIQDKEGQAIIVPTTKTNSDIRAFIENSNQRSPSLSLYSEKVNSSNVHHFENMVNSMAFMLPFQFLSPVPAPLIGSPNIFLTEQGRASETKDVPIPPIEKKCFSSMSINTENIKNTDTHEVFSKADPDAPLSDSSSLSSPPLSVVTKLEITRMLPESKMKPTERASPGSKKGRVYCTSCDKTFYDKGTLKIHYNAVHLKIKHKCTIEGCNMVFSSLRSRNRHSANPNPRLHMPMNRNNRDKDLRNNLSLVAVEDGGKSDFGSTGTADNKPTSSYSPTNVDSKMQSNLSTVGQSGVLFPNLKTVQPVLPFYRSPVTPAELANTPGNLPSQPLVSPSVPEQPPKELLFDLVPKKKSRKSSMPIKIEKESAETAEENIEDANSEDNMPIQLVDNSVLENCGPIIKQTNGVEKNVEHSTATEEFAAEVQCQKEIECNTEENCRKETLGNDLHQLQNDQEQTIYNQPNNMTEPMAETLISVKEQPINKFSDTRYNTVQYDLHIGGIFQGLSGKETSGLCIEESKDRDVAHQQRGMYKEDHLHHCEICKKIFKSPYSVKMHYKNVHLKEMQVCTVEGCNAAFPSRRSRDRHSANVNLHYKLLTKDSFQTQTNLFNATSLLKDMAKEMCQNSPLKEHVQQTSVIFKEINRTGLVFPMSKALDSCLGTDIDNAVDDGTVLDLSTTASIKSGSSVSSSCESDGGSEEGTPVDDREEICEGSYLIAKEDLHQNLSLIEKANRTLPQNLPAGLPITCHICQKTYSNKGTFRAHYKTVHLRQLHKCKVPGCNIMFSSVRSRNRHSQNPNLHKNMYSSPKVLH
ncbi:zinc finger protein basonuclin-1 isoform X2 [Latimeria chalumnae]|uniref:zinc finger protein basonuclin-1 isoform X2 n=1 Tax=Latimeria chalumnae TaxID=7897 RepID=UPI0003C1A795|nr:PREDICTED: zinc finger protein basonuclin-1 isoform X2 [Latimeria chalumnae]|eukprot:XP_005989671.1 PREDICTED: zinc finger protein basonuclin-1 isoform X2 [Latimeria chalumnae]